MTLLSFCCYLENLVSILKVTTWASRQVLSDLAVVHETPFWLLPHASLSIAFDLEADEAWDELHDTMMRSVSDQPMDEMLVDCSGSNSLFGIVVKLTVWSKWSQIVRVSIMYVQILNPLIPESYWEQLSLTNLSSYSAQLGSRTCLNSFLPLRTRAHCSDYELVINFDFGRLIRQGQISIAWAFNFVLVWSR